MAILIINVPETDTLLMNEFFDYDGICMALTRSRFENGDDCIDLEDFYDCSVGDTEIHDVPVVFVHEKDGIFRVLGWYRKAQITKKIRRLSLFLEGNVQADALDAVLLPGKMQQYTLECHFDRKCYEVIEQDDARYDDLTGYMQVYHGSNDFVRYAFADIQIDAKAKHDADLCQDRCMELARQLMNDECHDIFDVKALAVYAELLTKLESKAADGYYYLAMACHQLGQVKKGMKAIEKALKLENAPDLQAMKANLLVSMGYYEQAAAIYHEAWTEEGDQDYLILEGRAWMFKGKMDKAYACLKQVTNKQALTDLGINLKDMEHRWPFINVRGLKNFFTRR